MMYLVLTALLALNVSSEILNAFRTVNNSITTSNGIITDKNNVTYTSFEQKAKDPQTAEKAAIWKPKADKVKQLSADMYSYIDGLKTDLKKESDVHTNSEGKEEFKEDNLDAAVRLMDEKGKGKELYNKLIDYRKNVLDVLDPKQFAGNPDLQKKVAGAIVELNKSIPINMTVPKGQGGKEYENNAEGWTTNYFHMTPTIAALTILSKFQNDVKSTEAQVVDYCHAQIGQVQVVYNKFQAIATSNTSYAMPGDQIEITAGVGAFNDAAKPKITIGGQTMPLTPEGTAVFKTTASGAGDRSVPVVIEFATPDGKIEKVTKDVKYTIGVPSGASVFLEKMNVVYTGVDNPVTISGGSVGSEKVKVSFTNGSISRVSGDRYVIKPSGPGPAQIIVNADGKAYKFDMRCKRLPDPIATVGQSKGGRISAATFKAQGGVIAKLFDSEFDASFQVVSYVVAANGGAFPTYQSAPNEGARWGGNAASIISRATPGSTVFFDQIRVKGPDGTVRDLGTLAFQLQ